MKTDRKKVPIKDGTQASTNLSKLPPEKHKVSDEDPEQVVRYEKPKKTPVRSKIL